VSLLDQALLARKSSTASCANLTLPSSRTVLIRDGKAKVLGILGHDFNGFVWLRDLSSCVSRSDGLEWGDGKKDNTLDYSFTSAYGIARLSSATAKCTASVIHCNPSRRKDHAVRVWSIKGSEHDQHVEHDDLTFSREGMCHLRLFDSDH